MPKYHGLKFFSLLLIMKILSNDSALNEKPSKLLTKDNMVLEAFP